jgi:hypothetical protein
VSAWTEAELARKEDFVGRSLAVHWRDRRRSRVAEATSRADVLGGQLAEASGWPTELSARVGFLEKTLVVMARAWC